MGAAYTWNFTVEPHAANDKNLPLPTSKERLVWKEGDVEAIKELFSEEIKQKSVTMAVIRNKINGHPTLQDEDAKRICDKVRSEWRNPEKGEIHVADTCGQPTTSKLPEQTETLDDKLSRFFHSPVDEPSCSSSDVVVPSNSSFLSRNIFSDEESRFLLKVCGTMVRGGVISKPEVKKVLEKGDEGKEILRKFTIDQLIIRLKYERRLNNRPSK